MIDGMLPIDSEVVNDSALVIDANPSSRSVALQNLRSFGFKNVRQCSRALEARNILEHKRFNLVICDAHFDTEEASGIDLLEELRREQMLPYSTVFVMVASEATYADVSEAAESALDGFIIKPYSANALSERITEARQRKRYLRDIFELMERRDFEGAADLCVQRFAAKEMYWLYAARIGAELLMKLQRPKEAQVLFEAVAAAKALPWAKLGVARAQLATGDIAQARRSVEMLLDEQPGNADAHDILGHIQIEQGQVEQATASFERTSQLTPDCILRLQHTGTLNFYAGDAQRALDCLQRATVIGKKSRLLDFLSYLLVGFIHFDRSDTPELEKVRDNLAKCAANHPMSARLRRFRDIAGVLYSMRQGQTSRALNDIREMSGEVMQPSFDMESAINLVSLLYRAHARGGLALADYESMVRTIARRFVTTRASTELLLGAAGRRPNVADLLKQAQGELSKISQRAVDLSLDGKAEQGIEILLNFGSVTFNAKAIELAGQLLNRYRRNMESGDRLADEFGVLNRRYCSPVTHIAGVRRSGRSAGGLVLRT